MRVGDRLQTVGVFASVGHAEKAFLCVLQLEVFILKLVPVYGFSTCPISIGEVSTLYHELFDDAVESGTFIAKTLLSCCQGTEVLGGLEVP